MFLIINEINNIHWFKNSFFIKIFISIFGSCFSILASVLAYRTLESKKNHESVRLYWYCIISPQLLYIKQPQCMFCQKTGIDGKNKMVEKTSPYTKRTLKNNKYVMPYILKRCKKVIIFNIWSKWNVNYTHFTVTPTHTFFHLLQMNPFEKSWALHI